MVSDGFAVDLDALGTARDRVAHLAAELAGPPPDVPDAEAFGHDRLARAVHEFADRERRGRDALAGEVGSLHRDLTETIRTYRTADETGAGRFGSITW